MTEGEPPVRRDSLLAQFIGTSGGEAANRLAQLGSVALAGWTLGVTGLGIIGIAWSLTTIAQALTIGGPELIGIRTLVRAAANRDGSEAPPARPRARSQGRGCARPASEGATDVSTSKAIMIPASPDPGTSPVSGRDGGPARPCARSQGRGCARPASEGSLDESPSRPDGLRGFNRIGCWDFAGLCPQGGAASLTSKRQRFKGPIGLLRVWTEPTKTPVPPLVPSWSSSRRQGRNMPRGK